VKVLYHHRTQAGDAQGIHIYEMVKAFRDLGHEVDIVALVQLDDKKERKIRGEGWERLKRFAPSWLYELMALAYNVYGYWRLSRAIRSRKPDLIYERYALNTFCGVWASRRFSLPLVLEVNAPLCYEQEQLGKLAFKGLARFLERWICSHSTFNVVVSKAIKEHLCREGVPDEQVIVISNGIDPQMFHPNVSGEPVRRRYGLNGKLVVGFVGWMRKWHGLEMLLEVMNGAQLANMGVRLLLVGDGPAYEDLYAYAEKNEMLSMVTFTGTVSREDIPHYIAAMDVTVQPSATEYSCPMKIIEYMGMGKCIVATDQANIREILQDGVNACLFKPGDRSHLLQVLEATLKNRALREFVGKKACETVYEREYLWYSNAKKVLNLLLPKSKDEYIHTVQRINEIKASHYEKRNDTYS
jgi:glycosyltransferase involved in cell wall biosynthesis